MGEEVRPEEPLLRALLEEEEEERVAEGESRML